MRYSPAHAAKSGSVPFMLRGPKSVRTILSAVVAGTIAFAPAVMISSPAQAADLVGFAFDDPTISVDEGGQLVFEVTRALSNTSLSAKDLDWSISTGATAADATSNVDYTNNSDVLEFPADNTPDSNGKYGGDTLTITVDSLEDERDEQTEVFTLTVADDVDATLLDTAQGRIDDDDDAPGYSLVVNDSTPSETLVGGKVLVTAELDEVSGKDVTIPITVQAGTAKLDQDYTFTPGSITIPRNTSSPVAVEIPIINDLIYEENEQTFTIKGGTHSTVEGTDDLTVTIIDNEDQPEITINPDSVVEGGSLSFDVALNRASERAVTASWATADGKGSDDPDSTNDTAKAGVDYTAGSGTVTFPAATSNSPSGTSTAQKITVSSTSDSINENAEDMHVTLTNPTIGTLGDDSVATGTITDNDTQPLATLTPTTSVAEGSSGRTAKTYTVTLNKESGKTVEVNYDVKKGAGTATAVADFVPVSGTLSFKAGETVKTFTVDIMGDTMDEPASETFEIDLSSSDATVTDRTITITDDDAAPTFTVSPVTMNEGDTGSVAVYPVKLSNPSHVDTDFTVVANADTATATVVGDPAGDLDYEAPGGSLTIPAGQTTGYVFFLVNGDEVYEQQEEMALELTPTSGNLASASMKSASLTINNDDTAPSFEVTSVTGEEGQTVNVMGVVTGVAQANTTFNINFAGSSVNGGTPASADDFTNPGTSPVTITGGTLSGTPKLIASIPLKDDATAEGPENILASGTAVNGTVVNGVVTIAASDGGTTPTDPTDPTDPGADAPTLKASSSFRLGAGSVTLTGKAAAGVTVDLWGRTVNASDEDYAKISSTTANSSGTFTFTPGLSTDGMWFKVAASGEESDPVRVYVKQDPDLAATSTSRGVVRLVVTGDPKVRGLGARVFRANANGSWTLVGSGILNASGTFTKVLTGQASGKSFTYKSYVVGDASRGVLTNWSSYSKTVRVK